MRLTWLKAYSTILLLLVSATRCGAKTGLDDELIEQPDAAVACELPCPTSTFCEPACIVADGDSCTDLPPPSCDDQDDCTTDSCDTETDACDHQSILEDNDDDGYLVPERCGGFDCDDENPLVHPGALERCNGLDDDCDGQADEGADLVPSGRVRAFAASDVTDWAADIVWAEDRYIIGFYDYRGGDADVFLLAVDETGEPLGGAEQVTTSAADGFGPDLVWTGRELGATWTDRRDGNFEVYFARFDRDLERLSADLRITEAEGWSLYPRIAWSGDEYTIVWQDDRDGWFEIFGQRIGVDGLAARQPRLSSEAADEAESPAIAFGGDAYHALWLVGDLSRHEVRYVRLGLDLSIESSRILVLDGLSTAAEPSLASSPESTAIAWEAESGRGFETALAILSNRDGELLRDPAVLAGPSLGSDARAPEAVWSNAAFVLSWSELGESTFDLMFATFGEEGDALLEPRALTSSSGDAVGAHLAVGPGQLGVVWSDTRDGSYDGYFTRLLCDGL